jgi:hypothetical protein
MFRALLAHPQDVLQQTAVVSWLWRATAKLTLYARNIPSAVCSGPPEDEQVMLETCRGP